MASSSDTKRRTLGWLTLFAVGLAIFLYGVTAEGPPLTNADRAQRLGQQYACKTCNGQTVAESNAAFAQQVRRDIRRRIDEGETEQEINDFLVDRFGEDIDLTPRASGLVGLVWILPAAFFIAGALGLAYFFTQSRGVASAPSSDADRKLVEEALSQRSESGPVLSGPLLIESSGEESNDS